MATRRFVLGASLTLILGLGFLTVKAAFDDGVTILVVLSLMLVAFLAVGILGALVEQPPDGDE